MNRIGKCFVKSGNLDLEDECRRIGELVKYLIGFVFLTYIELKNDYFIELN